MVAVLLVTLSWVPGVARQGLELGATPDRPLDTLGIVLIVLQGGGVALLRRWPTTALAVVGVTFGAYQLRGYPTTFAALGLLVALVGAGALIGRRRRLVLGSAGCGYLFLAGALLLRKDALTPGDAFVFGVLLLAMWMAGAWVRSQSAARRRLAARAEQEAVTAERARIARDLHDVVTHHVTGMIVQAEAAQYGTADLADTRAALASVADGGRAALTDLRSLLGALDGTSDPRRAPTLQSIGGLMEQAQASGLPVALHESGAPRELTGAGGLAVLRILQESLTNARKHASAEPVTIELTYRDDEIGIVVASIGATRVPAPVSDARGIIGMRERAEQVGGILQAQREGERFVVRARIPA